MASPLLAMIGAITLFILAGGALIALLIYSTMGFMALFKALWKNIGA